MNVKNHIPSKVMSLFYLCNYYSATIEFWFVLDKFCHVCVKESQEICFYIHLIGDFTSVSLVGFLSFKTMRISIESAWNNNIAYLSAISYVRRY